MSSQPNISKTSPKSEAEKRASQRVKELFLGGYNDEPHFTEDVGLPVQLLDKHNRKWFFKVNTLKTFTPLVQMLREASQNDAEVSRKLSEILKHYRGDFGERERAHGRRMAKHSEYNYAEMIKMLKKLGIPIPSDEDFKQLEDSHGSSWDPDGAVVEYYSPVLRSFIPVNMRGRYRGTWSEDRCVQGLDISKIPPKQEALEGYFDRRRDLKAHAKFQSMFKTAHDEAHLDYLIQVQQLQTETLPIPIMFDVVNFGIEVLSTNLRALVVEEGLPPANRICKTTEEQMLRMVKKMEIYTILGLQPLKAHRTNLRNIEPSWLLSREKLIAALLARRKKPDEFLELLKEQTMMSEQRKKEAEEKAAKAKDLEAGDKSPGPLRRNEVNAATSTTTVPTSKP